MVIVLYTAVCDAGQYSDGLNCTACEKGKYQDQSEYTGDSCTPCPDFSNAINQTTNVTGSPSIDYCLRKFLLMYAARYER